MIVVECFADELLVKRMGFPHRSIHHAGCKGNVLNKVRKTPAAVGIVDEDPRSDQPGELKKYKVLKKSESITFLERENDNKKFVIKISPDLETWLLTRAKKNKIKPEDFSLPNKPGGLHRLTDVKRNQNYSAFLDKVIECDKEIKLLQQWISERLSIKLD